MICPTCASTMKMLFTSTYCPVCSEPKQDRVLPVFETAEDVRIALGLKPWEEWRKEVHRRIQEDAWLSPAEKEKYIKQNRGTGRTTHMLCAAVARVSCGYHVVLDGSSHYHKTMLVMHAQEMMTKLDVEGRIEAFSSRLESLESRFYNNRIVMGDHYYRW